MLSVPIVKADDHPRQDLVRPAAQESQHRSGLDRVRRLLEHSAIGQHHRIGGHDRPVFLNGEYGQSLCHGESPYVSFRLLAFAPPLLDSWRDDLNLEPGRP
jgi:hypothetical protein